LVLSKSFLAQTAGNKRNSRSTGMAALYPISGLNDQHLGLYSEHRSKPVHEYD
jgi:hypothetical protein